MIRRPLGDNEPEMGVPVITGTFLVLLTMIIFAPGLFGWGRFVLGAVATSGEANYFSTIPCSATGYNIGGFTKQRQKNAAITELNDFLLLCWSAVFPATVVARMGRQQ